jgi:DNA-binding response OmpR family regulator
MNKSPQKEILLVDSDEFVLSCLGDYLASAGFRVLTANTAETALKLLERETPHLIILELNLPGMGGLGFLARISAVSGRLKYPVLVFTVREDMRGFCGGLGIEGFLPKGAYGAELGRTITEILSKQEKERDYDRVPEGKKLLLAEDDLSISEPLERMLSAIRCPCETVRTGPEALEAIFRSKPDVVLLKEILPGMNGSRICASLARLPESRSMRVVLYDETRRASRRPSTRARKPSVAAEFLATSDPRALFDAARRFLTS